MCGHVGIAGNLEHKDEVTMKRLLLYDFFRGPDSTGFASVKLADKSCRVSKIASHPLDLFEMKKFTDSLNAFASTVFIGHNRAATKGLVNNLNAHPFQHGYITGCHNGTLDNKAWKELEEDLEESFGTDSEAIIAHIAKFGIEATIPKLQGAWALVWYDKSDNTMNFIRNKERPFWMAYSKDFRKLFWASEWPMIQAATKLSPTVYDMHIFDGKEGSNDYTYFQTEVNRLYTFDIDELRSALVTTIPNPKRQILEGKEPAPAVQGQFPFQGNRQGGTGGTGAGSTTTVSTTTSLGIPKTGGTSTGVVHFLGTSTSPYAGHLTKERFDEIASYGCSYCSSSIEYGDVGVTVIERDDIILCKNCTIDPTINRVVMEEIPTASAM